MTWRVSGTGLTVTATILAVLGGPVVQGGVRAAESTDERLLREQDLASDGPALLHFLQRRTPSAADAVRLEQLVRQLGNPVYAERERASEQLRQAGKAGRGLLRQALNDPDLEIVRRAASGLKRLEGGTEAAVTAAVVRLLADRRPAGAVEALLNFVPFADDDAVEEDVFAALTRLTPRAARLEPAAFTAVLTALGDSQPARRALAASGLARLTDPGQVEAARTALRPLLTDPFDRVRFLAARALLAAGDASAVAPLIDLLAEPDTLLAWQVEEVLFRLAGDQAPIVPFDTRTVASRANRRAAWVAWWRARGDQVDLARAAEDGLLGLTLAVEMDNGRIWESGLDGKCRWELRTFQAPIDAQLLPGGRLLVAEHNGRRVVEVDLLGNEHWSCRLSGNPIACQRLPNGNTFIATYTHLLEVTPAGREVLTLALAPLLFNNSKTGPIFAARKRRDGRMVVVSSQGQIFVLSPAGKLVSTISVNGPGGWCSVEPIEGDRYLLALTGADKVVEVDESGRVRWECSAPGPAHATRLPGGTTLIACMQGHRILEVDRGGRTVRETATEGRAFHAYRR